MRTSHVGSFPLPYTRDNVARIVKDLIDLGIDAPPYPQLRGFIEIYLDPLVKSGILSKIGDQFYLKIPYKKLVEQELPSTAIYEAEIMINELKKIGIRPNYLRAPVTGPFTLSSNIYLSREDICKGLTGTLLPVVKDVKSFLLKYIRSFIDYLVRLGFSIVFIDEPILGVIVGKRRILFGYRGDDIILILDETLKGYGVEKGVHICGRISDLLFKILCSSMEIRFINLEFHDTPENINIIDYSLLETGDKMIAPGIVSAKKPVIEKVDEAIEVLKNVYEKSRGRIDLVSADCGFKGLRGALEDPEKTYNIALSKLRVIVEAVKRFKRQI